MAFAETKNNLRYSSELLSRTPDQLNYGLSTAHQKEFPPHAYTGITLPVIRVMISFGEVPQCGPKRPKLKPKKKKQVVAVRLARLVSGGDQRRELQWVKAWDPCLEANRGALLAAFGQILPTGKVVLALHLDEIILA